MKKNWIKKGIVSLIMLAIFLAPVSGQIGKDNNKNLAFNFSVNKAEATSITDIFGTSFIDKNISANSNSVTFTVHIKVNPQYSGEGTTSFGTWNDNNNSYGVWYGDKKVGVTSGTWVNDNGNGNYTESNGYWKSTTTTNQEGEWRNGKTSGTWKATQGTGGLGTAVWKGGNVADAYSYIGGNSSDPRQGIKFIIKDSKGNEVLDKRGNEYYLTNFPIKFDLTSPENTFTLTTDSSLTANSSYTIQLEILGNQKAYWFDKFDPFFSSEVRFQTSSSNTNDPIKNYASGSSSSSGQLKNNLDLGCSIFSMDGIIGCVAGLFYMVWEVSAVVARFAGQFLDFFVYYSTNSSSYSNEFVRQAWGAVRDIANIFFIIALLYVAIKTILGLNVSDNKKLVGAVIIIGLIINFSLFTSKLVIDGTNILAKVFYNNITSKDNQNNLATGASGQKSISVGLINKYDPQDIVTSQTKYDESRGKFIFITILLIGITLYTAYIFFSVALLFVARVVSLWIYMIFSPIAFVSYATPFDMPGFGHKDWWKNLLENAMLAPLFIFFLYIIILFAGFLKGITDNSDSLMTVFVPFIILVVLLKKAKEFAVQYAGELGKEIQGMGAAVGGLAIGTAAGGTALLGRVALGKAAASATKSEAASNFEKYRNGDLQRGDLSFKDHTIGRFGHYINSKQKIATKTDHARYELEELNKKSGLEGVPENNMSKEQREHRENTYLKENRGEIESQLRKGEYKGKALEIKDEKTKEIYIGQDDFEKKNRNKIKEKMLSEEHLKDNIKDGNVIMEKVKTREERNVYDPSGNIIVGKKELVEVEKEIPKITRQGEKAVENELRKIFNELVRDRATVVGKERLSDIQREAKEKVGLVGRAMTKSTSGSYDIRNFSTKLDKRDAGISGKTLAKLTGAVAFGIRSGMKVFQSGLGIKSVGTPQGNFTKDMANLITEALKGVKFDIKLPEGGGHGGDHGGGTHSSAKRDSSHGEGGHGGGAHGGGGGHKH